jgi:hypothetical protein
MLFLFRAEIVSWNINLILQFSPFMNFIIIGFLFIFILF